MMTETKEINTSQTPIGINIEKTTKELTLNAYVTFTLFLFGALASCVGGFIGYAKSIKLARTNK